ncbi:hypothetical protein [Leptolyngbya sp. NIES-2104]|uniref:hypothetical protein n=1 Tax=Leptolyngbya sp. NIES-2104 TaxID=1552121 RepID=UPI0006ECA031|nr:hypothetical protein [Leptolyngbya sp. NIES-2104]GAQ00163.1 hypothetical protein NIES2104_67280 [Leptolyngbya sp. NIES-2104]
MPSKYDSPHYYYKDTIVLNGLCHAFGDYLERLSAIEKFDLIALLALWQSHDTEVQAEGNDPITLEQYLDVADGLFQGYSESVDHALQILINATEGDAIALLQSMSSQLSSGVFAQ